MALGFLGKKWNSAYVHGCTGTGCLSFRLQTLGLSIFLVKFFLPPSTGCAGVLCLILPNHSLFFSTPKRERKHVLFVGKKRKVLYNESPPLPPMLHSLSGGHHLDLRVAPGYSHVFNLGPPTQVHSVSLKWGPSFWVCKGCTYRWLMFSPRRSLCLGTGLEFHSATCSFLLVNDPFTTVLWHKQARSLGHPWFALSVHGLSMLNFFPLLWCCPHTVCWTLSLTFQLLKLWLFNKAYFSPWTEFFICQWIRGQLTLRASVKVVQVHGGGGEGGQDQRRAWHNGSIGSSFQL